MPDPTKQSTFVDLSGRQLGDYRLIRRLGYGGMADVYLAVQSSLKRNIALKILKPDLAQDKSYIERFRREAQSAAAIVHANIVQVFEVNQIDGFYFIAHEYVRGRNLKQHLARYGAIEPAMALSVLRQCAKAIQKADQFGVVHRDIKPENIMITSEGEAKITDFGLARIQNDSDDASLTQVGMTMGTPLYMSPEQVEGRELDVRSDIYSLGVSMYHLLAGNPPFDGESPLIIAVKQVKNEPVPLVESRPDVPDALRDVIRKMMAKEKSDRPQNAVELLKLLNPIHIEYDPNGSTHELFLEGQHLNHQTDIYSDYSESLNTASGRNDAALRDSTGKTNTNRRGRRIMSWVAAIALCAGGTIGGYWLAEKMEAMDPIVSVAPPSNMIPLKASAEEQYRSALWSTIDMGPNDYSAKEASWRAVLDYFPLDGVGDRNKTELYHRFALCRLGELYIESKKLDQAASVYDELASRQDISQIFRATGMAGQAVTLSYRELNFFEGGELERDSKIRFSLSEVIDHMDLLNQFMKSEVDKLLIKYPDFGQRNEMKLKNLTDGYNLFGRLSSNS